MKNHCTFSTIFKSILLFIVVFGFINIQLAGAQKAGSKTNDDTLERKELFQTKAVQLFVSGKYEEALREFEALRKQYPDNISVARYMGACLLHLGREQEAISTFEEILSKHPQDLPSHQYLAKIYIRLGDLDSAEKELNFVISNDRTKVFSEPAKKDLEAVNGLRAAQAKAKETGEISPVDFLKTRAGKLLAQRNFTEALTELQKLEGEHPQDLLIKRYKGIALLQSNKVDEAVEVFRSAAQLAPDNVPIRFYLAKAYLMQRKFEEAKPELKFVTSHDKEGAYGERARRELNDLDQAIRLSNKKKRRWGVRASGGFEYDTNPANRSRYAAFRTRDPDGAYKFTNTLGVDYAYYKKGPWSAKLLYNYAQALYTHNFRDLDVFTNSWGTNLARASKLFNKSLVTQLGFTISRTNLRNKYYNSSYSPSITFVYLPAKWYTIILNDKWSYTSYQNNGPQSNQTSKSGFYNELNMKNFFYLNKAKNFYPLAEFEYDNDATHGAKFHKNMGSYKGGLHFPLFLGWEGEMSYNLKQAYYPKYLYSTRQPSRRRFDYEHIFQATIDRDFFTYWNVKMGYTGTISDSKDDHYSYQNHSIGVTFKYKY